MTQSNPASAATSKAGMDIDCENAMVESLFMKETALMRFYASASASSRV